VPAAFLICEARARFGNRSHSEGRFFCMIGNGNSVLELWAGGCVKPLFFLSYSSFLLLLPSSLRDRRWVEGISGATSEFFFPFVSRFFNLGPGHLDSRYELLSFMTGNFFFCCNIWLWRLDIVASDEHARRWESDTVDLGWDGQAVLIIPLGCPFFFPFASFLVFAHFAV
jgi:hypothetical protein